MNYEFGMLDIRNVSAEELLQSDHAADHALAILTGTGNPVRMVHRIVEGWRTAPREERAQLLDTLLLICGLRKLEQLVVKEIHTMPFDIDVMENEVIREWIEKGMEQGRHQGLHEGQANILKRLIGSKFGFLPKEAEQRIENASAGELERWSIRLLSAASLKDVFD